jgi:AcrR family transcriptional regulator
VTDTAGLRARKKQRTRQAIVEAAYRLFDARGYDETPVSAIAAAAEISPATFYLHFPAKEDVLWGGQGLLEVAHAAIADRGPGEAPAAAVVRAIRAAVEASRHGPRDPGGDLEAIRIRLITTVPALRATTLHRIFLAQQELAAALRAAYPDRLDAVEAAGLVGAVVGAILAAGHAAVTTGGSLEDAVDRVLAAVPATG